jgi:hypothetical protein
MHRLRGADSNHRARVRAIAAIVVLAASALTGCKRDCPTGFIKQGSLCQRERGDVDAGSEPVAGSAGGTNSRNIAGTGMTSHAASAADAGASSKPQAPAIDPTVQWMCMKNVTGECTSCKKDADCLKHVCEQGYCMDCRESSQCSAASSCISNRCVPDRMPSTIWTTSGGGLTTAPGLKLQVSMGTPAPAASTSATGFKVSVAPGAGSF